MTKTVADLLQIARGALADIARNTDMTKDQLQAKANRIYWETEPSDEPTSRHRCKHGVVTECNQCFLDSDLKSLEPGDYMVLDGKRHPITKSSGKVCVDFPSPEKSSAP